jgi:hypothetical protein
LKGKRKERLRRGRRNEGNSLGVEKSTKKEIKDLCDNFTILHLFLLKLIHCVKLFCPFWKKKIPFSDKKQFRNKSL